MATGADRGAQWPSHNCPCLFFLQTLCVSNRQWHLRQQKLPNSSAECTRYGQDEAWHRNLFLVAATAPAAGGCGGCGGTEAATKAAAAAAAGAGRAAAAAAAGAGLAAAAAAAGAGRAAAAAAAAAVADGGCRTGGCGGCGGSRGGSNKRGCGVSKSTDGGWGFISGN